MQPAFSSTRQAAAFALLILVLLLLPLFLTKSMLPPREEVAGWLGWDSTGPHPYHQQLIFQEKGDIDIAFLGSSQMARAIDTPYLQDQLTALLGHPATVRTLAWGGAGYDTLYIDTKDLLQNRKVKMLVMYDEARNSDEVSALAPIWFRLADDRDVLRGLPIQRQLSYYYASVLGLPRNFLSLIRSNLPADMRPEKMAAIDRLFHCEDIVKHLGSVAEYYGYNYSGILDDYSPFIEYHPQTRAQPSDAVIYSPATQAQFKFDGPPIPGLQLHFARAFAALAQQHGVKVVLLHLPTMKDARSPVISEREFWPRALDADITMVGIPSGTLFEGMSDDELHKVFDLSAHLNINGQEYFTHLITPKLLEIYAAQIQH